MGAVFCPAEADEEQCRPPGASGLQLELTHRQNGLLSSVVPHGGTGLSWVQAQLVSPPYIANPVRKGGGQGYGTRRTSVRTAFSDSRKPEIIIDAQP